MTRTATITDDRLLEAARAEFLEHGIRATTAAIARRAGVSQGILFHRFGNKEALFAAAMKLGDDQAEPPHGLDLLARVGEVSVEQTLTELGERLLSHFFIIVPNQIMAWANPDPDRRASVSKQYRERGVRGQRHLVAYLRAEARLGRIRAVDPYVVAQTFGGALWSFAFEHVTGAKLRETERAPSRGEFVRRLVDTLWKGLRP